MYLHVIFNSSNYDTRRAHAEKTASGWINYLTKGNERML